MFEKASRMKLRFKSVKGLLTVEELWDLPLQPDLDELAKASYKRLQNEVVSFVDSKRKNGSATDELRLEILKHVIAVKLQEIEEKENLAAKKAKKERILDIIESKKDEELQTKSVDELKDMINDM